MAIVTGTSGDDKEPNELEGTELADQIYGLAGNDTLVGLGGDDLLEGGAGSDELWGGYGFDYASYQSSASPDGVYVLLSYADGTDFGDAVGDRLHEIEGVIGSAYGDLLQGSAGANVLRGGGGDDWLEGGLGNDVLDGGAGSDTAYFGAPVVADLASGTAQGDYTGSDRLAGIENLWGSDWDDQFAGDGGANALQGGRGADVLEGRGGADRFVYGQSYDSRAAAPDLILDFSRKQGDKIDLSPIDANEWGAGDPAFRFVGQGAFTAAGQVRFFKAGGDTVVEANTTDEIAGAELQIVLDPPLTLHAVDFVL